MRFSRRKLLLTSIIPVVIVLVIFLLSSVHKKDPSLRIYFLNVGQGDSILVITPHNKRILIDGGPSGDVVSKIPKPFWSFGCKLDVVVSTHSHSDHLTGLKSIIARCRPQLIIINDLSSLNLSSTAGFKVIDFFAGDNFLIDGVNFTSISPKEENFPEKDENENSLVLLMTYNDFSALFTGDAETCLYKDFSEPLFLLKVPHHGSYDPCLRSFLDRTFPKYSIISVGKNSFGHPNEKILGDFTSSQSQVFRTDTNGEIDFLVGKEGVEIKTGARR